jgi:hypothetical protein
MALWGKTDTPANHPKWIAKQPIPAGATVMFIDRAAAQLPDNRAKGIKSPGWWIYNSWTNADGSVQHSAELLVAINELAAQPSSST